MRTLNSPFRPRLLSVGAVSRCEVPAHHAITGADEKRPENGVKSFAGPDFPQIWPFFAQWLNGYDRFYTPEF